MKTILFGGYVLLLFFACHSRPQTQTLSDPVESSVRDTLIHQTSFEVYPQQDVEPDTLSEVELAAIRTGYRETKDKIKAKRSVFHQQYHASETEQARQQVLQQAHQYLLDAIPEQLLPYWYGTPWDFNGYSNHPREGVIACGYFVSTPLKHIGFPINRYRVAQQAASVIVDTLCSERLDFSDAQQLFSEIADKPDELYIVGLDYHVGFLLKRGKQIDFIHSSYFDPVAVVREDARKSPVFLSSHVYVLGPLLTPEGGVGDWLFAK